MSKVAKLERMKQSAEDFWNEIRPLLEPRLKATIYPLELLQRNELVDAFDQVGIDAFTVNRSGHLQGLASRACNIPIMPRESHLLPFAMRCGIIALMTGTITVNINVSYMRLKIPN